jgi:hypothetical protein
MSGMPKRPEDYYHYLQAHHQSDHRVATWHVDWLSLAWLWGFVVAMVVLALLWIRQYRTTRQKGVYLADTWSGYTTELAGPATSFFLVFVFVITAFAVVLIVGHLVWGQKF